MTTLPSRSNALTADPPHGDTPMHSLIIRHIAADCRAAGGGLTHHRASPRLVTPLRGVMHLPGARRRAAIGVQSPSRGAERLAQG